MSGVGLDDLTELRLIDKYIPSNLRGFVDKRSSQACSSDNDSESDRLSDDMTGECGAPRP